MSASCVALGSCVFFFIDAHKKSVERRRRIQTDEHHGSDDVQVAIEDLNPLSVHEDALALAIDTHEQRLLYLKSIAAARYRNSSSDEKVTSTETTSGRLSPFAAKADFMRRKSGTFSEFGNNSNTLVLPPAELTCISEEEAILENFLEDCVWNSGQMSHPNKQQGENCSEQEQNYSEQEQNYSEQEQNEEEEEGTKVGSASSSFASVRLKCHGVKRRVGSFEDVSLSLRDSDDDRCLINSIKRKVLEENALKGDEEIVEQCPCCKRCIVECDVELSEDVYERAPVIFEQSSTDEEDEGRNQASTRKLTRNPSIESNSESNDDDLNADDFNGKNTPLNQEGKVEKQTA